MITRKETIQEPSNPSKRAKEDTTPYVENSIPKERTPLFQHKVDFKDDTNEKTHGSNNYPSETDGCVRNLAKEHEN